MTKKAEMMLDSGAFSAWTQDVSIDLDAYIAYILENIEHLDYVVNLDVIPGWPNKRLTPEDIKDSATKGWRNYLHMINSGVPEEKIIHVFHQGENFVWLKRMLNRGMKYIGLSPANDKTTDQKIAWLDECMDYVTDDKGYPIVKFHGFGVTAHRLMFRYPWRSIDSNRWMIESAMGKIFVPVFRRGQYDYFKKPHLISISTTSPNTNDKGKHFFTLSERERAVILDYIHSQGFVLGKSRFIKKRFDAKLDEGELWAEKEKSSGMRKVQVIEELGVCNNFRLRTQLNVCYYRDLEKTFPPYGEQRFEKNGYGLLR